MFKKIEIPTFEMEDLAGKTLKIDSFSSEGITLIIGREVKTGEIYLLKEITHPVEAAPVSA